MPRSPVASLPPMESDPDPAGTPDANPAVAALLDHLAEELAREYVRLMEQAAQDTHAPSMSSAQEP